MLSSSSSSSSRSSSSSNSNSGSVKSASRSASSSALCLHFPRPWLLPSPRLARLDSTRLGHLVVLVVVVAILAITPFLHQSRRGFPFSISPFPPTPQSPFHLSLRSSSRLRLQPLSHHRHHPAILILAFGPFFFLTFFGSQHRFLLVRLRLSNFSRSCHQSHSHSSRSISPSKNLFHRHSITFSPSQQVTLSKRKSYKNRHLSFSLRHSTSSPPLRPIAPAPVNPFLPPPISPHSTKRPSHFTATSPCDSFAWLDLRFPLHPQPLLAPARPRCIAKLTPPTYVTIPLQPTSVPLPNKPHHSRSSSLPIRVPIPLRCHRNRAPTLPQLRTPAQTS